MQTVLIIEKLSRCFGSHRVIDNLSLALRAGERLTVFAPSGSGKTTLINILTGLDFDHQGFYHIETKKFSTIFQESRLFPHLTVHENILLPLQVKKVPISSRVLTKYRSWLDICGISERTRDFPFQLSAGMKQKVALIRCFMTEPDFVMMDEPFTSIDYSSKHRIIEYILQTYPFLTVLLMTHNLEEVPCFTQKIMVFKNCALDPDSKTWDTGQILVSDLVLS